MAATPEQQQQFLQLYAQQNPDFAKAPPELQQRFVQAITAGNPSDVMRQMEALHQQYPQYIKDEGILHNPAFWLAVAGVGGAIAAPAIAGALGGGSAAAGGAAGGGIGIGETAATTGIAGPIAGLPTYGATGAATGGGLFGALGKYGGIAGDVGRVASGVAGGLASGRREDANNTARAIAENNRAKTEAAEYNLKLPSTRTNQVSRGEVLNTMQNAPLTGDPRIDKFSGGGLRPSAFGPQSRAAGAELSRQAMSGLMNPSQDRLTPQEIPGTHPSTPEQIAAGLGIGADIFSLLAKYGGNPNGTR